MPYFITLFKILKDLRIQKTVGIRNKSDFWHKIRILVSCIYYESNRTMMNKAILTAIFLLFSCSLFSQDLIPTETDALLECIVTDPEKIPEEGAVVIVEAEDKSF